MERVCRIAKPDPGSEPAARSAGATCPGVAPDSASCHRLGYVRDRAMNRLPTEPLPRLLLQLLTLHVPVSGWGFDLKRADELLRGSRHLVHRIVEHLLVDLRGTGRSAQLADELQGRRADLLLRGRRVEVCQCPDVTAHRTLWIEAGEDELYGTHQGSRPGGRSHVFRKP